MPFQGSALPVLRPLGRVVHRDSAQLGVDARHLHAVLDRMAQVMGLEVLVEDGGKPAAFVPIALSFGDAFWNTSSARPTSGICR